MNGYEVITIYSKEWQYFFMKETLFTSDFFIVVKLNMSNIVVV